VHALRSCGERSTFTLALPASGQLGNNGAWRMPVSSLGLSNSNGQEAPLMKESDLLILFCLLYPIFMVSEASFKNSGRGSSASDA